MPFLALGLIVLVLPLLAVVLVPLSLVLRYRAGTARRRGRGWVATLNLAGLGVSTALFLGVAAITNLWVPHALGHGVLGLAAGVLLGVLGVAWTRWDVTPDAVHYTPSRVLVLLLTVVVTARMVYGVVRAWHAWRTTPDEASWLAASGAAGSLGAGALVLGYYLGYTALVRRRLARHGRGPTAGAATRGPR